MLSLSLPLLRGSLLSLGSLLVAAVAADVVAFTAVAAAVAAA